MTTTITGCTINYLGSTSSALSTTGQIYVYDGGGGIEWRSESSKKHISPKLYFNYVKSKLTEIETKKLKSKLKRLQLLLDATDGTGQDGLREAIEMQIAICIREQEALVTGCGKFVLRDHVTKFMDLVPEKTVQLTKLEEFSRPLPKKVRGKLKQIRDKEVFDEFWVLHNNLSKAPAVAKTTKEKIVEKDPILFGKFSFDKDRFFYIDSWVDEECNLTFEKFTDEVLKNKIADTYVDIVKEVPDLTEEETKRLKEEVLRRFKALQDTNMSNWKKKAEEEEALKKDREELKIVKEQAQALKEKMEVYAKLSWWKKLRFKF